MEQPPIINPNLHRVKRVPLPNPSELVLRIRQGDGIALARGITLVESSALRDRALSQEVVERCLPYSGNSVRIGITGVPGVGKSTFIEAFGTWVTEHAAQKLAVLAIDPTSQITKGSILGDKSRMSKLSASPNAFVRPSPTSGSLGGVARKTRESMLLCEAAGYSLIVIETVGVGQSELTVHSMVDCFLLLMLAGAGDEMQGIKRGIMEMADILAITKADGDNVVNAQVARQRYLNALHLFPATPSGWSPSVMLSSSTAMVGIEDLWNEINRFIGHEREAGYFDKRRAKQNRSWLIEMIESDVLERFYNRPGVKEQLAFLESRVMNGESTARGAAEAILRTAYERD